MNVTVIDAVMGAGKTYWMKHELARRTSMSAHHHERFVYITPYLKEAETAVKEPPEAGAQAAQLVKDKSLKQRKGNRKRDHLYELVRGDKSQ